MKSSFAVLLLTAFLAQAQTHRHFDLNVNDGNGETCADLKVTSTGEIARATDKYTLAKGEVSTLELNASDSGMIRIRAWDRAEFGVEACRIAVAADQSRANQLLSALTVSRSGGRFSVAQPQNAEGNWQVYFLVRAPREANLNLETKNGPIGVTGITGSIKVRATNGPLALKDCDGTIDAQTTNGPISFSGTGGDVHLIATNGPVSVKLPNDIWNGPQLEARTTNGPLTLSIPDTFQSSLRVETAAHSPFSCSIRACGQAWTDAGGSQRVLRMNGSSDTVRVSTTNGPLSVGSSGKLKDKLNKIM